MKEFSALLFKYREMVGLLFFIIATSIVIILYIRYRKKEHHKLIQFCVEHGYSLIEESYNLPNCPYKFSIVTTDYGYHKFLNIISGNICGIEFSVMDYYLKCGKSRSIYTFWMLSKPNYIITPFNLRPHVKPSFFFNIENNSVKFIDDKVFSDTFDLDGYDDKTLKKLFNSNLRNAFLNFQTRNFEYQSARGYFLILLREETDTDTKIHFLNKLINLYLTLLARFK